jgi:hypothetical protein
MRAPQIIMIVLWAVVLYDAAVDHGKPKKGTCNFFASLISACGYAALLIWGGFFG